jgi:cold shock protein
MLEHRIERRKDKLRVVLEVPLGELLGQLGPNETTYRARLNEYSERVVEDILEVGRLIEQEPENGVVKWFDDAKGYGFISGHDSTDIFVHWHGIAGDGYKSLQAGQAVRFKRRMGKETFEAVDVEPRSVE